MYGSLTAPFALLDILHWASGSGRALQQRLMRVRLVASLAQHAEQQLHEGNVRLGLDPRPGCLPPTGMQWEDSNDQMCQMKGCAGLASSAA